MGTGKETIRRLNDGLRTTFRGGRIVMTVGVKALGANGIAAAMARVQNFHQFTPDNDPHGEHDFGSFNIGDQQFFWKIDYYDASLTYGSEDPADPSKTTRVLTIMLAEEY
jgi:hypothetical protein